MVINQSLLNQLTEQAKASPRLRMNYDLRNSEETKLTTLLCNCAWSEMGHWSRDWKKKRDKGELEPQPISFVANPESYLDKLEAEANQMKEEERQAAAAMKAAANSYGGFNAKAVYLNPKAAFDYSQLALGNGSAQSGTGGSGGSNGSGSGSGSSSGTGGSGSGTSGTGTGGGSETPTVAAPTISGTTPFEESTSVTMSGPAGATIHYTTDGSTPTSASTAYSEAITLTDTTTVKAVAVKDGVSSSVTSRTFTKGSGGGGSETE